MSKVVLFKNKLMHITVYLTGWLSLVLVNSLSRPVQACTNDNQIKPVQVSLPIDWHVLWCQFIAPERMVLEYMTDRSGLSRTVEYNVATGKATNITLTELTPSAAQGYPSAVWVASPDGSLLLGPNNTDRHAVLSTLDYQEKYHRRAGTVLYNARWASDNRSIVEWTNDSSESTAVNLVTLSTLGKAGLQTASKFALSPGIVVAGIVSRNTIICARKVGSEDNGQKDWQAETIHLGVTRDLRRLWLVDIPGLIEVSEGIVAPDNGRIIWLVSCLESRAPQIADAPAHFTAELWSCTKEGKDFRRLTSIDMPDHIDGQDHGTGNRALEYPYCIDYVPGTRRIAFVRDSRVWMVELQN